MVSPNRIASIIDNGEMLPVFGIVPWKHHILIASKSSSIEEAFYYLQRTIDEGLSRSELEDLFADNAYTTQGKALTNFSQRLDEVLRNEKNKEEYGRRIGSNSGKRL